MLPDVHFAFHRVPFDFEGESAHSLSVREGAIGAVAEISVAEFNASASAHEWVDRGRSGLSGSLGDNGRL